MSAERKQLPWWTWIVPIVILHLGSHVSVLLRYDQGVSAYYLPTALSIIMIQWWGPARILPAVFLNAILSTSLWGVTRIYLWPVYGFTDVIAAFLSWYFFVHKASGKCWLPDVRNLLLFLTIGIILPVIIEIAYLEFVQIYFGDQPADQFVNYATINLISEFISLFGLTIPVLYYVTPFMAKHNFTIFSSKPERHDELKIKQYAEIGFLYFVLMGLTFVLHFEQ
jgi:hypothetical protein